MNIQVESFNTSGILQIGHLIQQAAGSSNLKRVTLELGGKSPNIVFKDADLDYAVEQSHFGLFFNQVSYCICAFSLNLLATPSLPYSVCNL